MEPSTTMSRNQGAKIPDEGAGFYRADVGRRGCGGWWVAAPFVRPKRALLLGGLGGAIRTSGWSDSPQWVERFAPVSGAIRLRGWSDSPHPTTAGPNRRLP